MFEKVLLPIDVTHPESWEKALPAALHCAGDGGEIHLLGIVHDLGNAMVSSFLPDNFEQKAMEELKSKLVDMVASEFPAGSKVVPHVGFGHVPEAIMRAAESVSANLIVMASHPANDFRTLLVGSNAGRVVQHATIPVLTVR